jgi:NADPH2:quinone reductase
MDQEIMNAWRVHKLGHFSEVLSWEECPRPSADKRSVVIKVAAAALNFPDILAIAGMYQVKSPMPFTPGLEAVGEIVECGADSRWEVGDRVIANNTSGAFAEYMAVPDDGAFRAPLNLVDTDAAGFFVTYQTSYFALVHRARLMPDEVVLIHGAAGGVGSAAIQIAKALGATVIATASSKEKLELCTQLGADHVINYQDVDFVPLVKELTDGRGADVIYDPIGGDVFDKSTRCIAFSGRLLVIGFTSGRIPQIAANRILLKNISIIGLHWGNYFKHDLPLINETHEALMHMYAEAEVKPMIHERRPMEELPAALADIVARRVSGKVVVGF